MGLHLLTILLCQAYLGEQLYGMDSANGASNIDWSTKHSEVFKPLPPLGVAVNGRQREEYDNQKVKDNYV